MPVPFPPCLIAWSAGSAQSLPFSHPPLPTPPFSQEKCPIYIHRRVWEDNSTPLRDLARKDDAPSPLTQRRGKGGATLGMDGVVLGSDNSLPSQVTSIRWGGRGARLGGHVHLRVA